ncbi:hypothetical protein HHE03_08480 [Helicobacter heilmannii]|uniref:Uncharacterized protein n=1 Tax=Helicobacter heilmannii TaxID=35817 RepID=A0A0K2XUL6_HELHE|nr:hypothetical protein HHE03_08480 [Helicobacter heilmannii]CRI35217.1 hypothetical protein HHE01_02150 [Helicobacter heilmannii]
MHPPHEDGLGRACTTLFELLELGLCGRGGSSLGWLGFIGFV